ncbi:MAG: YezD family protein [Candidatus Omnitrophica bacterium]|nr:YezD family protein [Candidatus Omnitrophota bacterium]
MEQPPSPTTKLLDRILSAISSIRYGTVQIVIQDAKVIQIEKTEKIRLDKADQTPGGSLQ